MLEKHTTEPRESNPGYCNIAQLKTFLQRKINKKWINWFENALREYKSRYCQITTFFKKETKKTIC